jgi:RNA polymerase sigma-70 factor, ECF subfamily
MVPAATGRKGECERAADARSGSCRGETAVAEPWLTTSETTDEALVARFAAGDLTAFSLLYDRYQRPVYVMAAHLLGAAEAEEIVQDVFLRLWRHVDQFDESRGRFAPWFMTIARHETLAQLRRHTRERRLALIEDVDRLLAAAPDPTIDVEEEAWRRERGDVVLRALQDLPTEQRRVLVLAYFGEMSQSTIAHALGWPLGTVKKRVRLGLQKLRQALAPHDIGSARDGSAQSDGRRGAARQHDRDRIAVEDGSSAR